MKKLNNSPLEVHHLNAEECRSISGGGDIISYVKCVAETLTSGTGGFRTFVLGYGLFGMARLMGVLTGCASI
jgi:hypothetical protein